ncbi:MAG: nitroreductase family protein [Ruminococcus sp.]|nr:nitroreductase family protein [Ruminococcus sp.]
MKEFLELTHERYSVRKFSDKAVEEEKLDKIIEAALAAPTAVNYQPVRLWLLRSEEAIAKFLSCTKFEFFKNVEAIIVVGGKLSEAWVRPADKRNFADVDASIVATQIMLEIADLGLGTTWIGHFDAPKLAGLFPDMGGCELIAAFPIGYPAEDCEPSPRHTQRRSREELVKEL